MTLLTRHPHKKKVLDLNGPEGNAFVLLGYAKSTSKELGIDPKPILAEMTSGNYRHLVLVFERHFGDCFDLVLPWNWDEYPEQG